MDQKCAKKQFLRLQWCNQEHKVSHGQFCNIEIPINSRRRTKTEFRQKINPEHLSREFIFWENGIMYFYLSWKLCFFEIFHSRNKIKKKLYFVTCVHTAIFFYATLKRKFFENCIILREREIHMIIYDLFCILYFG